MTHDPTIVAGPPVLPREPADLPDALTRGADIPPDLDPLAAGILMRHQVEWLEDQSPLKIAEKGRRTGITFAEALDDTITAATARSAGGDNIFYIGDTKDKGREFIGYVAHFAKIVAGELHQIEEFLFKDEREDGSTKDISAYRVTFASGFRVEALSSNPANIRGLQGIVVIDEAAYHRDVREVIDAVNALLIWGGKVRVISTHKGVLNAFNELILEARAGKNNFRVHHIPFQAAVANGLYKRVCLIKGKEWSAEAEAQWEADIRKSYGARTAAMRQELDAVPAEAEGAALTRVQIEACMADGIPFERWTRDDDFKSAPKEVRHADALDWCERVLRPHLVGLNPDRRHYLGEDFARSGDATDVIIAEDGTDLVKRIKLVIELRNIPFDQQWQILKYIMDRVPRLSRAALDKGGNGAYIAEKATQRYGSLVIEVAFTEDWYRLESPAYVQAFSDRTVLLPRHDDILQDHQALQYVNGVIRIPADHRFKGSDGFDRHGDSAVAGLLMWFASRQDTAEYGYVTEADLEGPQSELDEMAEEGMGHRRSGGLW